jgi:hypothetical protein
VLDTRKFLPSIKFNSLPPEAERTVFVYVVMALLVFYALPYNIVA